MNIYAVVTGVDLSNPYQTIDQSSVSFFSMSDNFDSLNIKMDTIADSYFSMNLYYGHVMDWMISLTYTPLTNEISDDYVHFYSTFNGWYGGFDLDGNYGRDAQTSNLMFANYENHSYTEFWGGGSKFALESMGWKILSVPEPSTYSLLVIGFSFIGVALNKRQGK